MNEKYSNILVEFFEKMSSWETGIVADRDISLAQMHLLEVVGNNNSLRMKELSEKIGVTTGTLTVMIHRLENKGYLKKEKDSVDRRSYFVKLTKLGKKEYDHHHRMHGQLIEDIVHLLGDGKSESFFNKMDKVQEVL